MHEYNCQRDLVKYGKGGESKKKTVDKCVRLFNIKNFLYLVAKESHYFLKAHSIVFSSPGQ